MKLYLVMEKESNEDHPLVMKAVLKIYRSLENAKDKMRQFADERIAMDPNWFESDTNGTNFIELKYRNVNSFVRYYILEKILED